MKLPRRLAVAGLLGLAAAGPLAAQDADLQALYRSLKPSVVALTNDEGFGTGVLLNETGLILTNAHVVLSPRPFRVIVDGETPEPVVFTRFTPLGLHPDYDLALVRIDPKEHPVRLVPAQIAPARAEAGARVFAIGFPADSGWPPRKTMTWGALASADRLLRDNRPYYQCTAAASPGNSGGPLIDSEGRVLGIVTYRWEGEKAPTLAIPLDNFRTKDFLPWNSPWGRERAREILEEEEPAEPAAPPPMTDDELTAAYIRTRITFARDNITAGRKDAARKALESILREYPDHAESAEAKRLLEELK
jgi:hypothetical protein